MKEARGLTISSGIGKEYKIGEFGESIALVDEDDQRLGTTIFL